MGIAGSGINTDRENFNDIHIDEIQKEYRRIDNDWLQLHYKTSIGLVIFACMVECVMGVIIINSDMLTTTVPRFVWKFIVFPSGINFLCLAVDTVVMKSKHFSQNQKIYTVSLVFVGICFILFTAHNVFIATYYIFAVAIMMTTIYASYRLTSITAMASIAAIVISELFIVWDVDKISIFESTLWMSNFLISLFIVIAFSIASMVVIRFEQKKNEASIQMEIERQQLQQSLHVDEMTGIFNRKALHSALKDMEDEGMDAHYILAITDIDNFKGINDRWGHYLGDRCLIEFAKILRDNCGSSIPFRYGGDEFCLLFRNVDMAAAVFTCEQIKSKLNNLHFKDQPRVKLTASFGLAEYSDQVDGVRLFMHSDYALYEAKEARNTIRVFQKETKAVADAETKSTI